MTSAEYVAAVVRTTRRGGLFRARQYLANQQAEKAMARSKTYDDVGSDMVDHTPDERLPPDPAPMPPDDATRLRELRVAQATGTLTPADNEELARLAAEESEAAGHIVANADPAQPPEVQHRLDMLGLVEAIIDTLPALRSLRPQLDAIKNRLDLIPAPTDKG